ncbi:MAG: hypothetical protein RB191_08815 [Terriglobia bacterium]|nr:hypothetical protein [Terriglobia bacterium]
MSDHDYSWVCNECGSDEYTSGVSEKDIENLACGGCGSNEFHKVFSPAPLQKDYTALEAENRKLREALKSALPQIVATPTINQIRAALALGRKEQRNG